MTAKKNLKRLVRARARKTGESYAAALSQIRAERSGESESPAVAPTVRRFEKPEYGFALHLPDAWIEERPDTTNSPWEVARFRSTDLTPPNYRRINVFRNPAPAGADARFTARSAQTYLERASFGNFRLVDATLAGHPATQLDFDRPAPTSVLACRQYRIVVDDVALCVGFSTTHPEEDAALFDMAAAGFELIGDLANAAIRPLPDPARVTVERPEDGFAVVLPDGWGEVPPNRRTNPWEVARFVDLVDRRHHFTVNRRVAPGLTANDLAEEAKALLAGLAFGSFRLSDATIAGRAALRMDCEQRDADRVWAARSYFTKTDGAHLILLLETAMPEQDAALFDGIAASFRLLNRA